MLTVIPAIDLCNGKAVRLRKGLKSKLTEYSDKPWTLVRGFAEQGATRVHVVDLDGAFSGATQHADVVQRLAKESPVPIQVGGGIRNREALEQVFARGASHAVLGTAAVKDPAFAAAACADFPGRIIVAVDAMDGYVAVEGWAESTRRLATDLAREAASWGAEAVLYTDIARDGTGEGVNVAATAQLARSVTVPVIASGGVDSLDDILQLAKAGIERVVVGRALYENKFSVAEAIRAARGQEN